VSPSELCGRYFDALVGCGILAPAPADLTRQKMRHQTSCIAMLGLPATSQTPAWLQGCIAALEASTCDPTAPPAACEPGRGTLPDGASCNESAQCQSGVCDRQADSVHGLVSCGTCATTLPEGAPCDATQVCAPGTACNYLLAPNRVCQAFGDVGTNCGPYAFPCRPGLSCFITDEVASTGSCTRPAPEGSACDMTACLPGLVCDDFTKKCIQPTARPKAGEPCDAKTLCEIGLCVYSSPTETTCQAIIPDGQSCPFGDPRGRVTCDSSTYCVDTVCTIIDTRACAMSDGGAHSP
jgi:hypothetical protein